MSGKIWTRKELRYLKENEGKISVKEMADALNRTTNAVRFKIQDIGDIQEIPESDYKIYDEPLIMSGNALVIPDLEAPFHHAEFLNKIVGLANAWGIRKLILAGDIIHLESLSGWGANWSATTGKKTDYSDEIHAAKKVASALTFAFDEIHYVIGNHDDRYLRRMSVAMEAAELLGLLGVDRTKWKIAPYYFSFLESGGETYRIEHPKVSGMNAARSLAAKFHAHILMGHSHRWAVEWDISGNFWAIQMGHCVDERRLMYAAQRSTGAPMHKLGAVIVRDGYPYVLGEESQFDRLANL